MRTIKRAWNDVLEWFNPYICWGSGRKIAGNVLLGVLLVLLVVSILFSTVWRPEKIVFIKDVSQISKVQGELERVLVSYDKLEADLEEQKDQKANLEKKLADLQELSASYHEQIVRLMSLLREAKESTEIISVSLVDPIYVPKNWSIVLGDQANKITADTFGERRYKLAFSHAMVPDILEAQTLISQKPQNITLSAWIGGIEEARNWPTGLMIADQSGWGTEVFLARDATGIIKYYYVSKGGCFIVNNEILVQENIYWIFLDTPAYRE